MSTQLNKLSAFQETIQQAEPVVIKFFAGWCPDCKRMDAYMPSVTQSFDTLPIYEIDKDQFPELAEKYDVMGIPSLLVFKSGEKLGHLHSAQAKTPEETSAFLEGYFEKKE